MDMASVQSDIRYYIPEYCNWGQVSLTTDIQRRDYASPFSTFTLPSVVGADTWNPALSSSLY